MNENIIPQYIVEAATRDGMGVLVTDYWLARRQRVHYAWIPRTQEHYAERELSDVLIWLDQAGVNKVWVVTGTRKRPRPVFRLTITQERP